jgi:hypothetical protein
MKKEAQILVNKYGQGLTDAEPVLSFFSQVSDDEKRLFINDLLYIIMQSKPQKEDAKISIKESGLKATFTPCIMLEKGIEMHNLHKIAALPHSETSKVMVLFLALFRTAYRRRFEAEKDDPFKWWYWDLSKDENLKKIAKS